MFKRFSAWVNTPTPCTTWRDVAARCGITCTILAAVGLSTAVATDYRLAPEVPIQHVQRDIVTPAVTR